MTTTNHERPLRRLLLEPPPLRVAVSAQVPGRGASWRLISPTTEAGGFGRALLLSQPDESDQPFGWCAWSGVSHSAGGRVSKETAEHSQPLSPVAWRADHQLMVATKGPMRQTHHCRVGPLFCVFSQRRGMARACDPS
jgi:hypothetical protein